MEGNVVPPPELQKIACVCVPDTLSLPFPTFAFNFLSLVHVQCTAHLVNLFLWLWPVQLEGKLFLGSLQPADGAGSGYSYKTAN